MSRLRRTSLVAFVWLAAFATLASGAPQITCICPDGRVMTLCLGAPSGCCCGPSAGTGCCGEREDRSAAPAHKPCCRCHAARAASGHSRLEAPGCRKTLSSPAAQAVSDPAGAKHVASAAPAAVESVAPPVSASHATWAPAAEAPARRSPPNLSIALRRLVI